MNTSVSRLFLAFGVIALALALVGLALYSQRSAEPTARDLKATAPAALEAPGSIALVSGRTSYLDRPAYTEIVGTTAPMADVLDYYESSLEELGFIDGAGMFGAMTSTETYACAWHGDGLVVRLSLMDLKNAAATYPEVAAAAPGITTIYRVLVIEKLRDLEPTACAPLP